MHLTSNSMLMQPVSECMLQVEQLIVNTNSYSRCSGRKSRSEVLYLQRQAS